MSSLISVLNEAVTDAAAAVDRLGPNSCWGIDGVKGVIADMNEARIYDTYAVKAQTLKTAIESAAMLLRIDDVVSGISKKAD